MSYQIESHAKAIGASFEATESVFNLLHNDREIFEALAQESALFVETFEALQTSMPVPTTALTSVEGHFYRLPSQNRSYCYALTNSDAFLDAPVMVFKGAEPLMGDFGRLVDWMAQSPLRKSSRVMTDHFPLAEGKIPGALSLKEAQREASIALEVQAKHLKHYGVLARMPIPLLIHSISAQKQEACAQILSRKLSPAAFERIEALLQNGIAIYIYYYPAAPIRANYLGDLPLQKLRQFLDKTLDINKAVTGWAQLMVRLLYLGYLPYTVRNEGLGACMDFGNATLDGGFCDPDSIVKTGIDLDDEFFNSSVVQSISILENTVQRLFDLSNTALYPGIEEFVCRQYVHRLIGEAMTSEARPGLSLDHRFATLISPRSFVDVKACVARKNRVGSYTYFAKRSSMF